MNQPADEQGHDGLRMPERSGRRTFLQWAVGVLTVMISGVLAWPLVGNLVGPIYRKARLRYSKVKPLEQIPQGGPVLVAFPYIKEDAYLREVQEHEVWVVRHPSGELVVFSPICPHLGCRVQWHKGLQQFICPCHGSVFAASGQVLGGPAPRPLDTLPHKVQNGVLMVEWERFKTGVAQKTRI